MYNSWNGAFLVYAYGAPSFKVSLFSCNFYFFFSIVCICRLITQLIPFIYPSVTIEVLLPSFLTFFSCILFCYVCCWSFFANFKELFRSQHVSLIQKLQSCIHVFLIYSLPVLYHLFDPMLDYLNDICMFLQVGSPDLRCIL